MLSPLTRKTASLAKASSLLTAKPLHEPQSQNTLPPDESIDINYVYIAVKTDSITENHIYIYRKYTK